MQSCLTAGPQALMPAIQAIEWCTDGSRPLHPWVAAFARSLLQRLPFVAGPGVSSLLALLGAAVTHWLSQDTLLSIQAAFPTFPS